MAEPLRKIVDNRHRPILSSPSVELKNIPQLHYPFPSLPAPNSPPHAPACGSKRASGSRSQHAEGPPFTIHEDQTASDDVMCSRKSPVLESLYRKADGDVLFTIVQSQRDQENARPSARQVRADDEGPTGHTRWFSSRAQRSGTSTLLPERLHILRSMR
jgi:hypothetical protein